MIQIIRNSIIISVTYFEFMSKLFFSGDKEILHTVMHWCLQRYDHLKKRAYLSKFLMPTEIPAEFMSDDLVRKKKHSIHIICVYLLMEPLFQVMELSQRLKEMQNDFKEVHKQVEQVRQTGSRPSELKADIATLVHTYPLAYTYILPYIHT